MSSSYIFVLTIIAMSLGFALIRAWMDKQPDAKSKGDAAEAAEMMGKIELLEERIRVLERIVTEHKIDLKQEIDRL